MTPRQSTNHIIMCVPQGFCANPQTMATNAFQSGSNVEAVTVQTQARQEAIIFADQLIRTGVIITHYNGQAACPDDLFCNNWVSTDDDGSLIVYPMYAPNRRVERRADVRAFLQSIHSPAQDLSHYEGQNRALESTGSLCLDRMNRVAYVALSARADSDLLDEWADKTGYRVVRFDTQTRGGGPVYHTNVMLFIGTGYAGLCADIIVPKDRARVINTLQQTHEVVLITEDQMQQFCGNALEVQDMAGSRSLVMSAAARKAFTSDQIHVLQRYVHDIIAADLQTIETHGGGSARCMLMEVF
ncbi:MAG: arginine deiminase-related protein [Pseudomonadota bacterium]